ncbi:MAG: TatD family hydrolase [Giesbergeria sp.]|jgi:TatD DNase family protein|nr:TatD family hydrolase [Giesbergeria sp.]MBP6158272.1 TatD family hydrolase [Giesbergeria sp.]MBP7082234.1 TatD family hydrolase [Giesbergeria sp.]MBP9783801.1 TatD family hydrolase [Giesbergeria sp.]
MPLWIDTHCHLDAREFAQDVDAVRQRARERGVGQIVIPAVDVHNFAAVRGLAHRHGDSYALGIHPLCSPGAGVADLQALECALDAGRSDPALVAVGEIGLDYFVPELDADHQEALLRAQLRLARRFDLPVLLHVRRSVDRVLKALREVPVPGGIAHAFNGSAQQARGFVDMGFKLGFGGTLTFDRALQVRRLAQALPSEAIVMETDAPDIPPHWLYRSAAERDAGEPQARNEPGELPRIAELLAQLRGVTPEALAEQTCRNAQAALPKLENLMKNGL